MGVLKPRHLRGVLLVSGDERIKFLPSQGSQAGFAGQTTAQAAGGIFDAAFLSRGMGITETGGHTGLAIQMMVKGKLGTVVKYHAACLLI